MSDAYKPAEIALRIQEIGVAKARADALTLFVLAVLAGAFIALGAMFSLVVTSGPPMAGGATRLLGGIVFALGLVLVVVAGAELFTGNNLIAMAWASGKATTASVLRNWLIVYGGNAVGACATAWLAWQAGVGDLLAGQVGSKAAQVYDAKVSLGFTRAVASGILCNALVCLAVWMAMGGRSVADKVLGIVPPVAAFVTLGFEHVVANFFYFSFAPLVGLAESQVVEPGAVAHNLAAVTLGNLIGGTLLVAAIYWLAYLRPARLAPPTGS